MAKIVATASRWAKVALAGVGRRSGLGSRSKVSNPDHSVVGLVDRLVTQKLVTREAAEEDRRQVYVMLTSHGLGVLEQLSAVHRTELRRIGPQIGQLLAQLGETEEEQER